VGRRGAEQLADRGGASLGNWFWKVDPIAFAGWGAKKLGVGGFGTVVAFLVLWWLLEHFNIFK
jgi:hypothetical protein